MFPRIDLEDRLKKQRTRQGSADEILDAFKKVLEQDNERDLLINEEIKKGRGTVEGNKFNVDLLDSERIYHIDQIKEICIRYRLRFLDTRFFKNPVPQEALSEIKKLEKNHNTRLKGFKIIAPSKLFKLEDADDPLLFAPMGNGYFYLIHKWGNDLNPFRRIMAWPFRNLENTILTTVLISLLASALVPEGVFSNTTSNVQFLIIFFFMLKSIGAIVLYYFFAAGKNFNVAIWNSKYFNA